MIVILGVLSSVSVFAVVASRHEARQRPARRTSRRLEKAIEVWRVQHPGTDTVFWRTISCRPGSPVSVDTPRRGRRAHDRADRRQGLHRARRRPLRRRRPAPRPRRRPAPRPRRRPRRLRRPRRPRRMVSETKPTSPPAKGPCKPDQWVSRVVLELGDEGVTGGGDLRGGDRQHVEVRRSPDVKGVPKGSTSRCAGDDLREPSRRFGQVVHRLHASTAGSCSGTAPPPSSTASSETTRSVTTWSRSSSPRRGEPWRVSSSTGGGGRTVAWSVHRRGPGRPGRDRRRRPSRVRRAPATVVAVVGISDDVTDQRAPTATGARPRRRLRLALDAGGLGNWHWDLGTGVTTWDPQLEGLFGLAPGAFDGRSRRGRR